MKRGIKSWAVFLASLLLMATILPLVTFKDVRADESDYSVSWKSGGAEAVKSYYDEIFEQDFRLFLNADKLVFEFKTDGESMNLKYKVFYGYDYSMPIVESDVVKNTTTLRCAFEPESGKYLVNDKIARGIYNFVVFDVDSQGNESYLYETAAHVTNTTNGIDFEFKCYAILKNDSGEICRSPELGRSMANVNGFLTKFKIGNAATIIPYSYEVTYDGKVLYTSPEYIYDPSDAVFGATAEYSERVYPIITKELNDFLKEGTYKITYYMFDLEEESFSIEMHIVNNNFPPKTTATFKDPDGYDSKTNVPYYNEPSKIYFDYSVDSNLEPYITLYKDGKPTGINRILRVGSGTNEIRNLDFDVFNEDGTLNYGNYELVFQNIFYEDVVKFPFSVYDKDGKIPTPTPSPTPTTEPTAKPTATPTPTKAPVTTVTPVPTKVVIVVPTKTPVATVTPVPTKATTVAPTKAPVETITPEPTKATTVAPTMSPDTTVTPTPTKATTGAPTKAPVTTTNPTVVPSKTPTAAPTTPSISADNGVGGFIERLYTVAMGRDFDEAGKDYWVNEIKVNGQTGAEVALQFLFSDEFLGKDMSNDQFLDVLYKTFFDRDPEEAGKAYWDGQMKDGMSKTDVIMGFINSPEWANICLKYGIKSGTDIQPTITITPNDDIKAFAEKLYTTCLGRDSEEAGLNYWADELANLRQSGSEVAKGFFFSPEFVNSKLDDSEYLTRLYKTVMGREPEAAGFEYWLGEMKAGRMSRSDVFDGFAASPEWIGICADYGILR